MTFLSFLHEMCTYKNKLTSGSIASPPAPLHVSEKGLWIFQLLVLRTSPLYLIELGLLHRMPLIKCSEVFCQSGNLCCQKHLYPMLKLMLNICPNHILWKIHLHSLLSMYEILSGSIKVPLPRRCAVMTPMNLDASPTTEIDIKVLSLTPFSGFSVNVLITEIPSGTNSRHGRCVPTVQWKTQICDSSFYKSAGPFFLCTCGSSVQVVKLSLTVHLTSQSGQIELDSIFDHLQTRAWCNQ
jgi:hypothetical protein